MSNHTFNMMLHDLGQFSSLGFGMPRQSTGISFLMQTAAQYASPAGPMYLPISTALGPLNEMFESMGPLGALVGLGVDSHLRQQFATTGLIPYGDAGSFYQAQEIERFRAASLAAIQSSEQDKEAINRLFRGAFKLAGRDVETYNPEELERFEQLVSSTHGMMALGAMTPGGAQLIDQLAGTRGSTSAMGMQMLPTSRFQIDPLTGQMGIQGETLVMMRDELFRQLYEEDRTAETLGIGAGQMGSLYSALRTEGLIGGGPSLREAVQQALAAVSGDTRREVLQDTSRRGTGNFDISDMTDLSAADLLRVAQNPAMSEEVIRATVSQAADRLKGYTRSIRALSELFEEYGVNATIPELLNSLKALTGNQVHRLSEDQTVSMINEIQAATRLTPLSVDQVLQTSQTARSLLVAAGAGDFAEQFSHRIAMSGIIAGEVSRDREFEGFGMLSPEQARYFRMNLDSRAVGSEMASNLAALSILRDIEGSEFLTGDVNAMFEAAIQGKSTYMSAQGEVAIPRTDAEFLRSISAQGLDVDSFARVRRDRVGTQERLAQNPLLLDAVTRNQFPEFMSRVTKVVGASLGTKLDVTTDLIADVVTSLEAIGPGITDDSRRRTAISKMLQDRGVAPEEAPSLAVQLLADMSTAVAELMPGQTLPSVITEMGPERQRRNDASLRALELESALGEAMRPLGKTGGLISRIADAVRSAGDEADPNIETVINEVLGAPSGEEDDEESAADRQAAGQQLRDIVRNRFLPIREKIGELRVMSQDQFTPVETREQLEQEIRTSIEEFKREVERAKQTPELSRLSEELELQAVRKATAEQVKLGDDVANNQTVNFPDKFTLSGKLTIENYNPETGEATARITQGEANPGMIS